MQKSYYNRINPKKTINAEHKYSISEYQRKRTTFNEMIKEILDQNVEQFTSNIEKQIFRININNIEKSINYQFNSQTQRPFPNLMKNFKNAIKSIYHGVKFKPYFQKNLEIQRKLLRNINFIFQESLNQDVYLQDIALKHHELNN